jgi:predicted MFS family arabinose efflux permease
VAGIVPEAAATEAFAWIGVGLLAGSSLGAALGGISVDALGSRPTFLLAAVVPAVVAGLLLIVARRAQVSGQAEPLPS